MYTFSTMINGVKMFVLDCHGMSKLKMINQYYVKCSFGPVFVAVTRSHTSMISPQSSLLFSSVTYKMNIGYMYMGAVSITALIFQRAI